MRPANPTTELRGLDISTVQGPRSSRVASQEKPRDGDNDVLPTPAPIQDSPQARPQPGMQGAMVTALPEVKSTAPDPAPAPPASTPQTTVVDNVPIVSSGSHIIVGSKTLTPGQVVTIGGKAVSLDGDAVVVGSKTVALPPPVTPAPRVMTINGRTITANAQSAFVIDGQTLSVGQDITVHGKKVHYGSDNIVIDGSTQVVVGSSTKRLGNSTDPSEVVLPTILSEDSGMQGTLSTSTPSATRTGGSSQDNGSGRRMIRSGWIWLGLGTTGWVMVM